ncbi:MAG: YgfZ/GcvT domain-containing protein [Phycisphaerae bacterium]
MPHTSPHLFTPDATLIPYGPSHMIADHYGHPTQEYSCLMQHAGIMTATHRGVLQLSGKDRLKFLHSLLTQDVASLTPGDIRYSFMLNVKGRIIADMVLVALEDTLYLDIDARLAVPLMQTLERYLFSDDVTIFDASGRLRRLSVIGPEAAAVLAAALPGIHLPAAGKALPCPQIHGWTYRRDLLGVPQWELAIADPIAAEVRQRLATAAGGAQVGWSAFNITRVAAGTPWYGIDITDQHLPMETGPAYLRAVHLSKGCYVGQEVVARMHSHKTVARALMGMEITGTETPAAEAPIYDGQQVVGHITSAAPSPIRPGTIAAMGYVKKAYASDGRRLSVQIGTQRTPLVLRELSSQELMK